MEKESELYQHKAEAKLREIGAKIDQLKAKSEQANADLRIEINRALQHLEQKRDQVQSKLSGIRTSGGSAFKDLKAGVELALGDLKAGLDSALDRFR